MRSESILINSLEELNSFAEKFAQQIKLQVINQGLLLGLNGELAAGKTTFSRLLVAAMGSNDIVSSPSYVLEHIYKTKDNINIRHWDIYRLMSGQLPEELYEEPLKSELIIVEWSERSAELRDMLDISINFELISDNQRRLNIIHESKYSD